MTKEWVVQAELNGRFGAVRRSDVNGTRRTFETREAAQAYCDTRNENKNMNMTAEEKAEIKRKFSKLLNSIQKRTVLSEATYETINNMADEFTNALYAKIDSIWNQNGKSNAEMEK